MSIRVYKITTVGLGLAVIWLGLKYLFLSGKVLAGAFVSHQADRLRTDIDIATHGVVHQAAGSTSDRDRILYDLNWYLTYYDAHTNTLARSPILGFLRTERDYVTRDAIAYLRKTGTNDFGDDPNEWLRREYLH